MVYVAHEQIKAMTLTTRIAVLNHGRVEQFDTPEEVHRRPASLFVAAFVGSPGMNLVPGRIESGQFFADAGRWCLRLPRYKQGLADGQSETLGIRPEDVTLGSI